MKLRNWTADVRLEQPTTVYYTRGSMKSETQVEQTMTIELHVKFHTTVEEYGEGDFSNFIKALHKMYASDIPVDAFDLGGGGVS